MQRQILGALIDNTVRTSAAPMVLAAAKTAYIDDHRENQEQQIEADDGFLIVDHPRVGQSGQGQKDKSKDRQQQAVVGVLQIV